jgi:glycosyltransferase involved in cell wall biosynthesis
MSTERLEVADLRILVGLTEISGYGRNLVVGLRERGVTADLLDLTPPVYRYGEDKPPTALMRLLQRAARTRATTPRAALLRKAVSKTAQIVLTPFVLLEALFRYDAFILLYDSTFLGYRDVALLRRLGKPVIYVFCGSDVRPPYMDGGLMAARHGLTIDDCVANLRAKQRMLRLVESDATAIVSHPLFAQLQQRPFVSFLEIGIPRKLGMSKELPRKRAGQPLVIHAPSNPDAKGTSVVRETMERLRERGYEFVYEEVQGVANSVLLARLRDADLVVDMVWGDTPMAGLAADAAWFGCPTVVGGYGWAELREVTRADVLPPAECCAPEDLEEAIGALLVDPERRQELGRAAHEFVNTQWSAEVVAARFLRLLQGAPPPEWVCDPAELRYVLGWGQPIERTRELARAVLERGGVGALGLADKPAAERALLEIAR